MHNNSETLIFIDLLFSTIQFHPVHSVAGVCSHSCRLYQAYAHIAVEPILTTTNHDSDLQTQRNLDFTNPYTSDLNPSYPLPLEPRSVYTFPWAADHGQAYSLSIILHYF